MLLRVSKASLGRSWGAAVSIRFEHVMGSLQLESDPEKHSSTKKRDQENIPPQKHHNKQKHRDKNTTTKNTPTKTHHRKKTSEKKHSRKNITTKKKTPQKHERQRPRVWMVFVGFSGSKPWTCQFERLAFE